MWIPGSRTHRIDIVADAHLWLTYWSPKAMEAWAPEGLTDRAFALRVSPLLRELLRVASAEPPRSLRAELVVRLVLQELTDATDAPTFLPLPSSDVGRRVSTLVLADLRAQSSLEEIAARAGSSERSVSRLFPAETGLTFRHWRQRARIVLSIPRLAAGTPIQRVAHEAGFASAAAFSVAFRQVTMVTPSAYQLQDAASEAGEVG